MDIYRNTYQPVAALDRPRREGDNRTPPSDEAKAPPSQANTDRRRQPDRRRRQEPFDGPDRRQRKTRRRPLLLDPKTAESAPLEDRRGRLLDAKA